MSLFLDRKYIGLVAFRLQQFKKKTDNLYNFRCPICFDSKKNKLKARGYLFVKGNSFFYKCHNCNESQSFSNFLKSQDLNLHKKYILERFQNGENKNSNYSPKKLIKDLFLVKNKFSSKKLNIPSIAELPKEHFCRKYIEETRKVPNEHLKSLYFAKDFADFVEQLVPGKYKKLNHDPKLIIPFFDINHKLVAIQGRALVSNERYITIKIVDDSPKIFGLDRVDETRPLYVLEGPLDSLFIENAIAAAGSDLPTSINPENCIFVFDNQNKNKEIVSKMNQIIDKGYKIFVWPKYCKQYGKDINDLIQEGWWGPSEIKQIIDNNTYQGLKAKLEMMKWVKG